MSTNNLSRPSFNRSGFRFGIQPAKKVIKKVAIKTDQMQKQLTKEFGLAELLASTQDSSITFYGNRMRSPLLALSMWEKNGRNCSTRKLSQDLSMNVRSVDNNMRKASEYVKDAFGINIIKANGFWTLITKEIISAQYKKTEKKFNDFKREATKLNAFANSQNLQTGDKHFLDEASFKRMIEAHEYSQQ